MGEKLQWQSLMEAQVLKLFHSLRVAKKILLLEGKSCWWAVALLRFVTLRSLKFLLLFLSMVSLYQKDFWLWYYCALQSLIDICIENAEELLRSNFGKEVIYEVSPCIWYFVVVIIYFNLQKFSCWNLLWYFHLSLLKSMLVWTCYFARLLGLGGTYMPLLRVHLIMCCRCFWKGIKLGCFFCGFDIFMSQSS